MRKIFLFLFDIIISLVIVAALTELTLRAFPGFIPLSYLVDFQKDIREEIAMRRHLPTEGNMVFLERDDGGPPLRIFRPVAQVHHEERDPGAVETLVMDGAGFCNTPPNSYDRSTFDVMVIGDSFTWCTAVRPEDTWVHQLSFIAKRSAYNFGVPGRGVYEYIQILKHFGIQKTPKVVIMNIYEGNDLRDAFDYHWYRERVKTSGGSKPSSAPCSLGRLLCPFYRFLKEGAVGQKSYAFNLAATAGRHFKDRFPALLARFSLQEERLERNSRYYVAFPEKRTPFNVENAELDELTYAQYFYDKKIDLNLFTDGLESFVEFSRRHHFLPVVTYTPAAYTVYAAVVTFEDPSVGELMSLYSREQREFFRRKADELGYQFVDLTSTLQRAAAISGADNFLYFPRNTHLTPRGHRVIAEVIAGALR